ncbi:LOW QUALITY PROTEIN: ral guanine nucleotide dissociation stimulator-like 2 [Grus americana]|uniref:LOW QUALITY PROTEIN: ral guanine nucleotide dissociation stimulator-like 2 n=1 Tax=Grus americana TaxID=9117 RepID=UPI00240843DE|nr:LOW QUALITY PROTEIN: ral guanine nucleotide dissociation stimulator-like 2 [Grus americana]
MLPRALRALLEGSRPPPGQEPGVVLSAYRPCPPETAPPQAEEREEGPCGAVFSLSPGPSRRLRAAPLPRLVRHLLEAPARGDAAFVPAFLGTFRAFARPQDVLGLLLLRLEELGALSATPNTPELTEAKAALSSLLCSWLDGYPEDFGGPQVPPLAERLVQLLGPGSEVARRLEDLGGPPPPPEEEEEEEEEGGGDADPLEILSFQAREVAEQLTLTEAELFLRLVPYECLGALWSRRDKRGREGDCPSVRATVRQFNRLAGAVVRSCLGGAGLRPPQRARLLEKWIHVAEECRALRNFSSLCAIISALQSSPVHRLRQSWDETSRDAQRSYEELSAICSEQDNYSASRQLLLQDPPSEPPPPRRQPRRPPQQRPVGVVPYLGTFLRDLVMLDAAMKDELEDGYINFEKRRKEFGVLAQVRGLQGLCRGGYRLHPQPRFRRWLRTLRALPEAHSHSLSCEIEPPGDPPPPAPRPPKPALVITHCTELLSSVGTPSVAWDQPCPPSVLVTPPQGPPKAPSRLEQKWPSVSALDEASAPPSDVTVPPPGTLSPPRGHRRSASCGSTFPPKNGGGPGGGGGGTPPSDCRIIRARMDLHNGSLYKSILITSQDKTPAVVAKVLEKHGQDPAAAPRFQLLQLLPENRELLLPPSANVFYAMTGTSLDFTLRPRDSGGDPALSPPPVSISGG